MIYSTAQTRHQIYTLINITHLYMVRRIGMSRTSKEVFPNAYTVLHIQNVQKIWVSFEYILRKNN